MTDNDDMITRDEFDAFKMKFDLWCIEAEKWRVETNQKITELELANQERKEENGKIMIALVRLETSSKHYHEDRVEYRCRQDRERDERLAETLRYREQVADTLNRLADVVTKLNDRLTDHIVEAK